MSKTVNKVRYTLNPCKENIPPNEIKAILRCAHEVAACGGRSLLAKMLKGSKDKKVLELKLYSCPYYGFYKDLIIEEITSRIDYVIEEGYLRIEYDYRLPLLAFTEAGWEIEKETYSDELFERLREISETKDFEFIKTLKDKNRGMIFLLFDKIQKSRDSRFLRVLEYWKGVDYKKVRARIDGVMEAIGEGRGRVIKILYEIGKYICEKEGKEPLTLSLREQFESFGATKEICIKLKEDNNKVSFIEVENPIEIDLNNSVKYGIMHIEKKGANLILFYKFNGKVAKKIHQNRKKSTGKEVENVIVGFEDNFINFFDKNNKYYNVLQKNKEKICERLLNIDYSTDKTENYLLTISINNKYPNEIEEFKSRLKERFFEKNINKSNGISYSDIKKCSICNKSNKLVGYLNLNENYAFFNFAGSNAKSIFARNYHTANAYKNNGICSECSDYINFGSHYINNNLFFLDKIIGKERKKFFVFPLLYFSNTDNGFEVLISAVKKKFEKDHTISDKNKDNIEMWEELISEIDPAIQFNIIFISYEPGKQSREIIKSIYEVLPSRMMKILQYNKIIENELKSRIKSDNKYFFPLKVIWNIITHKDLNKAESIKNYQYSEYLNFIASIFSENEKISYIFFQTLYNKYMIEIIQKYEKIDYAVFKILDVFYLNLFLLKINIFYHKEGNIVDFGKLEKQFYSEYSNAKFIEQYWQQFKEYPQFFNSFEKCFAFLMGRLTSETRYAREGKGSFIDGWLSNFSTNIYKLPQLLERCTETLSIENELLKKQNNIIAITSFFSKLISIDKLEEFKDDLIFPFVSGFSFYYKIVFEKIEFKRFQENILDKLSNEEDKNFLLKCYKIDNESKYYILDKTLSKEIRDKIKDLI